MLREEQNFYRSDNRFLKWQEEYSRMTVLLLLNESSEPQFYKYLAPHGAKIG